MKFFNSKSSDNNTITTLETVTYKNGNRPVAAKTLLIENGENTVIGYGNARQYMAKSYSINSIEDLSKLLNGLENDPYTFVIRGQIKDHIDINKPIFRRKNAGRWDPKTISLEEAALSWLMLDLDKIDLPKLGFNQPLQQLNPQIVCDAIISRDIPELANTTYHYQLSNTAGWKNPHNISIHLWFWLSENTRNDKCKTFVKSINARSGFKILDPALYNAAQPHYTAKPILGFGVKTDPIANRSGLVKKAKDTLSLPDLDSLEFADNKANSTGKKLTLKKVKSKKSTKSTDKSKTTATYKWPKSLKGWIDLIKRTDDGVHKVLLDVTLWKTMTSGIWPVDWQAFEKKIKKAFIESERGKKEPNRIGPNWDGEYQRAVDGAMPIANEKRNEHWKLYSSNLVLSHPDAVHINERFITSLQKPDIEISTIVIDSDLGTGKSKWFYNQYIKDGNPHMRIVVMVPRRTLAEATANTYGIVNYQDAKKRDYKNDIHKIALCVNSSLQLINPNEPIDVLFLDEFDLTIQHLLGNAVPSEIREELIYHVIEIIRNAKHVVCAQSLISDLTLFFLEQAERTNIMKIVNDVQPWKDLEVDYFRKKDKAIERLLEITENGTPFLCPCNSSAQALSLYLSITKRFPQKNFLLITQDCANEKEQADFLGEPDKHAQLYDGVIFSPTLESGVSIDSEHFQETIGFCAAGEGVNTPDAFVQMLLRGRKTQRLSIWVDQQQRLLPDTEEACAAEVVGRFETVANVIEKDGKKMYAFEATPVTELAIKAQTIKNQAKNNTNQSVYDLLTKRMGCKVNLVDDETQVQPVKDFIKESRELRKEQYERKVQTAQKIDQHENAALEQKQKKHDLTQAEYWTLRRFKIEHELCVDLDKLDDKEKLELFHFWNEGRVMSIIRGFEEAMLSKQQATAVAKCYLEERSSHDNKHGFYIRWLIRNGIAQTLGLSLNKDGVLEHDPEFKFSYKSLKNEWWYKFAIENKDAVNAAKLGHRINGKVLQDKELGRWIRAMGIQLKRYRKDVVTELNHENTKYKESGSVTKRKVESHFGIDTSAMTFFLDVIQRRWQSGRTEYVAFANRLIAEEEQNAEQQAQPSSTKISIKIDDKTIQKVRKILEEIGRDERINNAVAAFDAIEEQAEKYELKNLLALEIFWRSIWQFMVNFGDTSKEVFLDYVSRELGFEVKRV
jgi:hypothetical protein